ncbi:MAG: LPP20 family lipoprotein [Treponema sp.]|nr:LPP20 family lipoprotein [Treponema sp.]
MFRKKSSVAAGLFGACLAAVLASCATGVAAVHHAPVAQTPEWTSVAGDHERFSRQAYLTARGHGSSRQAAEMDAFRQLVTIFGVDVQADVRLVEAYRGRAGGAGAHTVDFGSEIVLGAGMDNLIGAEIGDRWDNGRNSFYALAVLNKARAAQVYSEMIRANLEAIAGLTDLPAGERNSFDGFSRYQFAAVIADMNAGYAAVLSAVGSPRQGLRTGDDFRRDAQAIAAAIPIGVNVPGDRAGRIQGAFGRAFSDLGFRTGGTNQRYVLDVDITLLPTDHQANVVFSRMELSANLVDVRTGSVLLPFTFNVREGHRTQSEAENRVFLAAERRINDVYRDMLSDYLMQLIPGR